MKKNFFKKLATVLSLAMVVTSVAPLAGTSASAAATPDIKTRRTTAYEGNSYSYAVKNAKGYTVKWAVSGKLATISKAGKLTVKTNGAKAGTVVVSAAFYKNGKKVVTRKDSVAIKVSAKSVAITTKDVADFTAVPAGDVIDFNRTLTPANSTSKTYWSVTDKDGAATTTATIDAAGKLTATAVGEYVVTATVRNAATSKVVATATQAITVKHVIKEAKQIAINKVNVVFGSDVSKVITKSNISVEAKDTKANAYVKAVTFSADGKTATLEVYNNFTDKKAYTVTYDKKAVEFVASVGDVASVVVKDKTVKFAEPTDLDITLLDANGIDVTTATEMAKVTAKTTKNVGWVDLVSNGKIKVTLYNVGDVTTVTATYATGKYDTAGKSIDVVSNVATITAVKDLAVEGTLQDYTAVKGSGAPDWSKAIKKIAVKDTGKLYFKGNVNGKDFDSSIVTGEEFESSNSNILIVNKDGSYTAVAEGTAYVTGKYNNYTSVFAIEVGAERKAAGIALDKSNTLFLSKKFADAETVKVTVKDQYGDDMAAQNVTATLLTQPNGGNLAAPDTTTTAGKVTFNSATTTVAGTYQYKLTLRDLSIRVDVTVSDNGDATVATYRLEQSNADFDLKVTDTTATASNVITVAKYNAAGVKLGYDTTNTTVITVTKPDGSTYTPAGNGTITIPLITVSGGVVTKNAATGTYNVKVEVAGVVKQTTTFVVKDTQALPTVTVDTIKATNLAVASGTSIKTALDNANAISAVLGVDKYENATASGLNFTAVEVASANNVVFSDGTVTTTTAGTYQVFLKTVTFTGTINGNTVTYVVTVNHNLTINVQ